MIAELTSTAKFLDITAGNIITWLGIVIGVVATWQKIKITQDLMAEQLKRHESSLDVIRERAIGTAVLTEHVENYHLRIRKLEEAFLNLQVIQNDVKWIKGYMRKEEQQNEKG